MIKLSACTAAFSMADLKKIGEKGNWLLVRTFK